MHKKEGELRPSVVRVEEKKGQVTIFIIIAILIIGAAVTIYLLIPKAETEAVFDAGNPQGFIQTCLEDEIEKTVDLVSSQGGSVNPEHIILYEDNRVEYLCYTTEYYLPCKIQRPLLTEHIEDEIRNDISEEVEVCFNNLQENYRNKEVPFKNDEAGYFRIAIQGEEIMVKHYLNDGRQSAFEFKEKSAGAIYKKIINENLISRFDHAAYLGQELARAEECIKTKKEYIQEGS